MAFMTREATSRAEAPYWSLAGLQEGARLSLALAPGTVVFGAAFGTLAAQKGMTLLDATLMSALIFSGMAQFVAMGIWSEPLTLGALVTLSVLTAVANMRYVLMGASLRPWFGSLPAWQSYPPLFLITDSSWLIGIRYRNQNGSDVSVFAGASLALWLFWIVSTLPGYMLGELITDPKRFGVDFVMPAFFAAMLVPLWRGPRAAIPWIVAGAVSLVASWLIPGWWFIVIGALAGSICGAFVDDGK